jgi:hypothetical protein
VDGCPRPTEPSPERRYNGRRPGPLAQLVEQGTLNPKVAGSIPARPIENGLQIGMFWAATQTRDGREVAIRLLTRSSRSEETRFSSSGSERVHGFSVPRSRVLQELELSAADRISAVTRSRDQLVLKGADSLWLPPPAISIAVSIDRSSPTTLDTLGRLRAVRRGDADPGQGPAGQ